MFLRLLPVGMCLLSNDIHDYFFVSQGKTEIPGVDDAEEMRLTDVSKGSTGQHPTPCSKSHP